MSNPAEELYLAKAAIRQHMFDCAAANQMKTAADAEKRLTALEAMTPEEFAKRYEDQPLDSE